MIAVNFNILNQKGAPAVFEDEAANRPPAGLVGRLFIATDTKTLQRDNGTAYDTIGDNSLLGARNGLTLAGNYVELGGTLIKHTALAGNYNIALGSAAVSNIKFLTSEVSSNIIEGSASIVGTKLYPITTDASTQNFYVISGNLNLDLTNAKVTGANTLNATALNGYVNINGNNGQSTRAIRSIMATGVFNNVNLAEFRSIDIKAYDFNGTNAITNAYGLYIDSLKTGEITNAYGIYQAGANDVNYFAGKVGIGTTSPTYKLDVNGNAQIGGIFEFTSSGKMDWGASYGNGRLTWDAGYAKVLAQGSNVLKLYTESSGGGIDILANGNVGIKNPNPNYEFDVTGAGYFSDGVIIVSPDSTKYKILVDNTGALSTVAV